MKINSNNYFNQDFTSLKKEKNHTLEVVKLPQTQQEPEKKSKIEESDIGWLPKKFRDAFKKLSSDMGLSESQISLAKIFIYAGALEAKEQKESQENESENSKNDLLISELENSPNYKSINDFLKRYYEILNSEYRPLNLTA